ncbi:MAG TPA: hypothetical protein VHT91_47710 [Kofleriaceae bacterium]|nr:hypothetical protein [Kofleriaceae bacterium]
MNVDALRCAQIERASEDEETAAGTAAPARGSRARKGPNSASRSTSNSRLIGAYAGSVSAGVGCAEDWSAIIACVT